MRATTLALALALALAGCGRPDSNVVIVRTVTRTTTTTTTSSTDDTPTPTTDTSTSTPPTTTFTTEPPDPNGPALSEIQITEVDLELEVAFTLAEGDAPLDGGTLTVALDDGEPAVFVIPDDLYAFDGVEGTVRIPRPTVGRCALGADHELALEAVDTDALSSGTVVALTTTQDVGVIVDEIGEENAVVLGVLTGGALVCGELESTGNDGYTYDADIDYVAFEVDPSVQATVELDWDAAGDYDLLLYTIYLGYLDLLDEAAHGGFAGPETVNEYLYRNESYIFGVAGWRGDAGAWTVEIF
jgi:hypothetical protein